MRVKFPEKLGFLSEPHRYKVLYGGRGGIKSWSIAQHLLIDGSKRKLRIPCARETMQSIRESVHQLLEDQIQRLGLQAFYEVQKAEIIGSPCRARISCGSKRPRTFPKSPGPHRTSFTRSTRTRGTLAWTV